MLRAGEDSSLPSLELPPDKTHLLTKLHNLSPFFLPSFLSCVCLYNCVLSWLCELAAVSLAAFENHSEIEFVIPYYRHLSASQRLNPCVTFSLYRLLGSNQIYLYRVPWKLRQARVFCKNTPPLSAAIILWRMQQIMSYLHNFKCSGVFVFAWMKFIWGHRKWWIKA